MPTKGAFLFSVFLNSARFISRHTAVTSLSFLVSCSGKLTEDQMTEAENRA